MSSNPSVRNIVIESLSALPLKSAKPFKSLERRIARECSTALETLGSSQDVSVHENKVDRLLRAHLRFIDSFDFGRMSPPANSHLSPGIYAGLLSIQKDCYKEIRELIKSNLTAVPDDPTALRLQRIVWIYLLQKLLPSSPDNLEVMQLLFIEIPSFYWSADFIPSNTQVLERDGMKIPYEDGVATTLRMAIQGGLYLYVAEVILQAHMRIEPTVFLQTDVRPLDSRLRLLLSMVGSPSIRSMAIPAYPFSDRLLDRFLQAIGDFLGVSLALPYIPGNPVVALDPNRHAVLKLLYILISSADFDDTLTRRDQAFVLITFFRVLNSTSPLPPFLAKEWCTPQLATKSVQVVFEAVSWDWPRYVDHEAAYELLTCFFQNTSFTNEDLAFLYQLSSNNCTDGTAAFFRSSWTSLSLDWRLKNWMFKCASNRWNTCTSPIICSLLALPSLNGATQRLFIVSHWNRIARSERGNEEAVVIVADIATDTRKRTGIVHVIAEGPDRANAPNTSLPEAKENRLLARIAHMWHTSCIRLAGRIWAEYKRRVRPAPPKKINNAAAIDLPSFLSPILSS
ncbi:hypothetical protein IW262DRAFT_694624 [Armillaria fumosa]|nr:hypothetical protein IW262DRAFT_694624 [Armillaria fumosa]